MRAGGEGERGGGRRKSTKRKKSASVFASLAAS